MPRMSWIALIVGGAIVIGLTVLTLTIHSDSFAKAVLPVAMVTGAVATYPIINRRQREDHVSSTTRDDEEEHSET